MKLFVEGSYVEVLFTESAFCPRCDSTEPYTAILDDGQLALCMEHFEGNLLQEQMDKIALKENTIKIRHMQERLNILRKDLDDLKSKHEYHTAPFHSILL